MLKKNTNLFLLLFFFLFVVTGSSQTKEDSLVSIWKNHKIADSTRFSSLTKHINLLRYNKPDSAIIISDNYYKIAKEKNNFEQMAWAINYKGLINLHLQDLKKSKILFNEALDIASKIDKPILEATLIGNLGITHSKLKDYSQATLHYTDALKKFKEFKDEKGESRMLNNLGGLYLIVGDYDMALNYYNKSLQLFEKNKITFSRNRAILMLNIGSIELQKENFDKAISAYNYSLDYFKSKQQPLFEAITLRELAIVHYEAKQYQKAASDANNAATIFDKLDQKTELLKSNLILAKITYLTDVNKATKLAETILADQPKLASKELKKDIYELLYKCYKAKNKSGLSLKMYENFNIYKDSIQNEKNNFAIIKQTIKNDFDILLYENKLENEKDKAQLKLTHLKKTFGIISSAAIFIACILFYFKRVIKKNREKRELLLQELEQLKSNSKSNLVVDTEKFELIRDNIEFSINRKLNETDWKVLNILLEEPEITNKEIAKKAYMSIDGIGSSLRRMYEYFDVKNSKYKKITLLTDAIKRSNN